MSWQGCTSSVAFVMVGYDLSVGDAYFIGKLNTLRYLCKGLCCLLPLPVALALSHQSFCILPFLVPYCRVGTVANLGTLLHFTVMICRLCDLPHIST